MTATHHTSVLLAAAALLLGQSSPTIRVDVNLVQVDAVVTDSKNRHVPDLRAVDFEILQDGKPQTITNFSYVTAAAGRSAPTTTTPTPARVPAPPIPSVLAPDQVRRTVALVVDDLGLSFESMAHVRDALRKFVNREMQPRDMVAILRTSGGMGVLQQFTTNRDVLNAAVDHIKFTIGRMGVDSFAPVTGPPQSATQRAAAAIDELRTETFMAGTLGALRYVIDGLRDMPGRKSVVLFSENLQLYLDPTQTPYTDEFRRLTDAANRASVVINTIDPRGLQTLTDMRDQPTGRRQSLGTIMMQRAGEMFDSQTGLAILAQDTGGLFVKNNNLIDQALDDVIADTGSYYLIGYHPDAGTFDSKTGEPPYHKIEVRLKVAGLHVRSRSGFFGESDPGRGSVPLTGRAALMYALASPFSSAGVHVRLTTLFTQTADRQSRLSEFLYIDPRDLEFRPLPDGSQQAFFEVVSTTFGIKGDRVEDNLRAFGVNLKPDEYKEALRKGFVYVVNTPVRRPGMYQLRVALLDQNSERLGSASEFVKVPDLSTGHLALSSILLRKGRAALSGVDHPEGQAAGDDSAIAAATRVFRPGDELSYEYLVFNAKSSAQHKPSLEVETRLFRDGKQVYAGQPMVPEVTGDAASGRLLAGAHMTLTQAVPPGEYVLQIVVTDKLAREKYQIASEWTDFELQR